MSQYSSMEYLHLLYYEKVNLSEENPDRRDSKSQLFNPSGNLISQLHKGVVRRLYFSNTKFI